MSDPFCEILKDMCDDLNTSRGNCTGSVNTLNQLMASLPIAESDDHGDLFFWSASILFGVALGIGGSFLYNRVVNSYQNYNKSLLAVKFSLDQP